MIGKTLRMLLGAVCALWALSSSATLSERWVFVQRNLQHEADFAQATNTIWRAHGCGYNAVAFLCGRDYAGEWLELVSPKKDAAFVSRTCGPDRPHLMSPERRRRYAAVREFCRALDMRFAPLVWSMGYCSMQAFDPEMCAVFPVREVPYVVRNGRAVFAGGDRFPFGAEETVVRPSLETSELLRVALPGRMKLKPWRRYRYSLEVKTEGLASQLRELQGAKLIFHDAANYDYELHHRPLPLKPTQDWTKIDGAFNSEDIATIMAEVGVWRDKAGVCRFRNLVVEEVGLQFPVCRDGAPLVVRDAATGRIAAEGQDYLRPPRIEGLSFNGPDESLSLGLPLGGTLAEGMRLLIDSYEPATEYGIQFSACPTHPGLARYFDESAREICDAFAPDAWFLSADEYRVECRCACCMKLGLDMAHKYADALRRQHVAIRRVAPAAEILFWSDMADENHNARDRYCKCRTTYRGLADLLPKDLVAVPWWTKKARLSGEFFSSRGFGVMGGAYYDKRTVEETVRDARDWMAALEATPTARGIMYTAWYERYDMLDVFARTVNACESKKSECDFKLNGVKEK